VRVLAYAGVFSFVAGLVLLAAGLLVADDSPHREVSRPFDSRTPIATAPTATPALPGAPTATPTTPPFDGPIARMVAPAIGLDHAVEPIGIVNGQLDVPRDGVNNVGWYEPYPRPGHGKNAVFAAHVNFNKQAGPFAHLAEVEDADEISIVMEGGPTYVYRVIVYARYDVDTIPTGDLIAAPERPPGEEWITLITCGGDFVPDPGSEFGHYQQRDVVIATRVR
jgi:sortase (surface protein transpeptidase)